VDQHSSADPRAEEPPDRRFWRGLALQAAVLIPLMLLVGYLLFDHWGAGLGAGLGGMTGSLFVQWRQYRESHRQASASGG
jgi:hypothetical protein